MVSSVFLCQIFWIVLSFFSSYSVDAAYTRISDQDGTDYTIYTRLTNSGESTLTSIEFPLTGTGTKSVMLASVHFNSNGKMTFVKVDNQVHRIKYKNGEPVKAVCKSGCDKRDLTGEMIELSVESKRFDQNDVPPFDEGRDLQVFESCDTCKDVVKLLCGGSVAVACLTIALLSGPAAVAVGALCAVFGGICALDGGAEVQCQQLGDCPTEEEEEEEESLSCGIGECDIDEKCCIGNRFYFDLLCKSKFGHFYCCGQSAQDFLGC
mmetsp:Transcript_4444/g.5884  ORF Transcript_4444/g.5884 Transcript_4444/m.5884 type:complete len:265 (-) Transcript_4444:197-991(-)